MICFIHMLPGDGESGCRCMRGGETGSALPATTQLELFRKREWHQWLRASEQRQMTATNSPMKRISIPLVIHRHEIHHHNVHGLRIQTADAHLECREHASSSFGHNHFGALLVKFIPQLLGLKNGGCLHQSWMVNSWLLRFTTLLHTIWSAVLVGLLLRTDFCFAVVFPNGILTIQWGCHIQVDVIQRFVRGAIFSCCLNTCWGENNETPM